jgi:hypothetical protein
MAGASKASGGNPGQFSVNGQRADANYFTVDGVSANVGHSAFLGIIGNSGGNIPGLTAVGGFNNLVSIDALQEFKIQTSTYAPEFGRTPGGQISLVTRSGTNDFRGTLFNYFRNDVLDANDWFANSRNLKRPPLRQNNFGGVLGGPIWLPKRIFGPLGYDGRNQTFFFFSYEGQRVRQPQVAIINVPSRQSRQNAPASVKPYLNAFPLPTGPDLANGLAELAAGFSNASSLDATSIRLDHTVNKKLTLFGRYNHSPSEVVSRRAPPSNLNPQQFTTDTATIGSTLIISPSVNNDLRVNWSRNRINTFFDLDDFGGATPPPDSILYPAFTSRADSQFQFNLSGPVIVVGAIAKHFQRQVNIVDGLSIVAGPHQVKVGIDYRRLSPIYNPPDYTFNYFTGGVANALRGLSAQTSITANAGPFNPVFHNFSAYAQDTWKATRRLTLTFGLRWDYSPPPKEANGKDPYTVINLDNPAAMTLAPQGTPLYETTYDNFAPRVGLAVQLVQTRGRELVLRGGFGLFYDLGSGDAAGGFGGYPFSAFTSLFNTSIPLDLGTVTPPAFKANPAEPPYNGLVLAFEPNLKLPRTYQWNVSLEQSLGANQTLTASYVAAQGRRLLRKDALFQPNPKFTSFVIPIRNAATSDYHALQLQFQRRLSRGLQALTSYTWAKSLDNASDNSNINAPVARINPKTDRGPSDFDVRHSFSTAVTYNLPRPAAGEFLTEVLRDWAIDTIFSARSATPVNVFTGRDVLGIGVFATQASRPDLVLGAPLYIDDPKVAGGRRINRDAFTIPTGRQGTLGRNALRGFSVYQLDFGVRRMFSFTERFNMQFRAEFFNIFNHPNFGDPQGSLLAGGAPNALFGQSTQMLGRSLGTGTSGGGLSPLYQIGGPRSIQLALKLQF